jgi:regulatory protein
MGTPFKKILTKEEATQKIKHYCGYQERCHAEVKEKLYGYGLRKIEVEALLSQMVEEDYLNEERFAIQFAGGKFRMKQWGKQKIKYELQQKRVSEYCIKKALAQIDTEDYEQTLQKTALKKWNSLKGEQYISRQAKTMQYLLRKGYESKQAAAIVKDLQNKVLL